MSEPTKAEREAHANGLITAILGDIESITYHVEIPDAREFFKAARQVLWVLDGDTEIGEEPGGFNRDLILLIARADRDNQSLLARVYPTLVAHVHLYKNNPDAVASLRRIARYLDD